MKIDLEKTKGVVKNGCKIIGYCILTSLPYVLSKDLNTMLKYSGSVGYSDAVDAIMNSDMWSHDKHAVMSELKQDKNDEFYKSIIHIANSDMFSHDKVKAIKNINNYGEK